MKVMANIRSGPVGGARLADDDVDVFHSIPYAGPPLGSLRWRPPVAPAPWTDKRDCRQIGPAPIQRFAPADSLFDFSVRRTDEDCLTLSVWAPADHRASPRPVIVWFHIGAFQFGSGSAAIYDGANWARAGAVFVSVNFRLGRLGFLAHPELTEEQGTSGNYGLLDQIAALEWVRDNIAEFGGDPGCVTIYGASSGATSVSLLMVAPRARGLFHRAIAESGGSFGPSGPHTGIGDRWQHLADAERSGRRWALAENAGDLATLRALDADAIRRANARQAPVDGGVFDALRPIVDGNILPESSYSAFEAGRQALVPLLVGSAAQEEFVVATPPDSIQAYRTAAIEEHGPAARTFLSLYPARTEAEAADAALRATGHRLFTWQNWAWARLHARHTVDTYYYRFDQPPPLPPATYGEQRTGRSLGAFHAASLFYTFGNLHLRDWAWTDRDRQLARTMIRTWVQFARTGVPSDDDLPTWPRFDPDRPSVMSIADRREMQPIGILPILEFWDRYYARAQRRSPTTAAA